jgi:hypothetical protein
MQILPKHLIFLCTNRQLLQIWTQRNEKRDIVPQTKAKVVTTAFLAAVFGGTSLDCDGSGESDVL